MVAGFERGTVNWAGSEYCEVNIVMNLAGLSLPQCKHHQYQHLSLSWSSCCS